MITATKLPTSRIARRELPPEIRLSSGNPPVSGWLPNRVPHDIGAHSPKVADLAIRAQRVSDHKDLMAVVGVGCEFVSAVRSLIGRERTGNFATFDACRAVGRQLPLVIPRRWKAIPYGLEQGTPGAEQGIDTSSSRLTNELGQLRRRRWIGRTGSIFTTADI